MIAKQDWLTETLEQSLRKGFKEEKDKSLASIFEDMEDLKNSIDNFYKKVKRDC